MSNHDPLSHLVLGLGLIFLLGLTADELGRRTRLPRVTVLVLLGLAAGPSALGFLPDETSMLFDGVAKVSLTMVGFLLGEKLVHLGGRDAIRTSIIVSLGVVVVTALVVFGGMLLCGAGLVTALLLAGIATATDPAATIDVIEEADASETSFGRMLLAVVAIDDAWGLILFSVLLGIAGIISGTDGQLVAQLGHASWEILGAAGLGSVLGLGHSLLSQKVSKPGNPVALEALGLVLLACGLALVLEVSFILTAIVMGAVGCRLGRGHDEPFHAIERIEQPFLVVFFILAGAALEPDAMRTIGGIGVAYVLLRVLGRFLGGWSGGRLGGIDPIEAKLVGPSLLPQAGVALGMALVAADRFPDIGSTILQVTIGTTVVFELFGPPATKLALARAATRAGSH